MIDKEKCHYCGMEFRTDTNDLSMHLHRNTEVLAELPALLGSASQMGSIDLHDGQLYSVHVRPAGEGECFDEVKTRLIQKDEARLMLLAELNFHEDFVRRLSASKDSVLARLESL